MPRHHRHRPRPGDDEGNGLERLMAGWKRTEDHRDGSWFVQPVSGSSAQKTYVCPGCGQSIPPGTAHVVTWRADGVLGDQADIAARRHWHSHCWRIR
ncbi:hypothetical protein EAO79_12180 [Plantibacter sp. PA-3-X8]|jgi:hypothetical protein|uniref:ATP/GTP-binding protein n=1 Tax=Plantibacter elymi (nom. nud.) TaxID=199708 RepID=A0ABY1RDX6_9MICO|nr:MULTISPECIES: hypothetical protein [Plantibacter]AQX79994.1 hypothetical protein BWO91_08340 [Plantibacter flavus]AZH83574.1 hypothetical protein EAO79_12180 [Plantibacter sp. PA-3-X8]MBD8466655.1 hypothetical protein [Plantibacter sp. CFBP 8798]MBD8515883.1 hypothetical protein [Plantibacter sp. CFBP 8804]MDD9152719.1 hypothetical protein [Plantibacter flavus]